MECEDKLLAKVKKAQESFVSKLPKRLEKMNLHLQQAISGDWGAMSLLDNDFHALFGTAATYGFVDLGDAAREAREILQQWDVRSETGLMAVSGALRRIKTEIEKCTKINPAVSGIEDNP